MSSTASEARSTICQSSVCVLIRRVLACDFNLSRSVGNVSTRVCQKEERDHGNEEEKFHFGIRPDVPEGRIAVAAMGCGAGWRGFNEKFRSMHCREGHVSLL